MTVKSTRAAAMSGGSEKTFEREEEVDEPDTLRERRASSEGVGDERSRPSCSRSCVHEWCFVSIRVDSW